MSEYAPSFPLFIVSVVLLVYCVFNDIFRKEKVKRYKGITKTLFYAIYITSAIVFVWGIIFLIMYWLE